MTGCTVRWLIGELEKVENKDRQVRVFESDFKADKIEDAGTIREVARHDYGTMEKPCSVWIYTWR